MTFDIRALAATRLTAHVRGDMRSNSDAFRAIVSADFTPYLTDQLHAFVAGHPNPGMLSDQIPRLLASPQSFTWSLPLFADWLVAQDLVPSGDSVATEPAAVYDPDTFDADHLADVRNLRPIAQSIREPFLDWSDRRGSYAWGRFIVSGDDSAPGGFRVGERYRLAAEDFVRWAREHRELFAAAPVTTEATDERHTLQFWIDQADYDSAMFDQIDHEWMRSFAPRYLQWRPGTTLEHFESDYVENPGGTTVYIKSFFRWMLENPVTTEEVAATTTPTTTEESPTVTDATEPRIIPIGPEHPGFQAFAEQLAEVATRNGMCPEYDRIARAVGLPTRKQRVTYRVTIDVPVDVERDHNADVRQLREAAAALIATTDFRPRSLEQSRVQIVA